MKRLCIALALASAACAAPVLAAGIGVSISLGEPGFYGQLDVGNTDRPVLVNRAPVEVVHRYRGLAPIYLRVPPDQRAHWSKYCDRYNACARPVYFVRDDWYQKVYAPRYREMHHGNDRRDDRNDDHHDHDDHGDHHGDDHR